MYSKCRPVAFHLVHHRIRDAVGGHAHQINVTADARFGRSAPPARSLSQLVRLKAASQGSGGGVTPFRASIRPSVSPAGRVGYRRRMNPDDGARKHNRPRRGTVAPGLAGRGNAATTPTSLSSHSRFRRSLPWGYSAGPGGDRIGFCSLIALAHMDQLSWIDKLLYFIIVIILPQAALQLAGLAQKFHDRVRAWATSR